MARSEVGKVMVKVKLQMLVMLQMLHLLLSSLFSPLFPDSTQNHGILGQDLLTTSSIAWGK